MTSLCSRPPEARPDSNPAEDRRGRRKLQRPLSLRIPSPFIRGIIRRTLTMGAIVRRLPRLARTSEAPMSPAWRIKSTRSNAGILLAEAGRAGQRQHLPVFPLLCDLVTTSLTSHDGEPRCEYRLDFGGEVLLSIGYSPRVKGNRFAYPEAFNFFTRTFEFRPLWSYFSRRSGGRSSGVPSAKPPFDWK